MNSLEPQQNTEPIRQLRWEKPRRISRVYPLLTTILLLANAVFVYAWQVTQVRYISEADTYAKRQESLEAQVKSLSASKVENEKRLALQEQQITDQNTDLTKLKSEVETTTKNLAAREKALRETEAQIAEQKKQLSASASEIDALRNRPPLFNFKNTSGRSEVASQQEAIKTLITKVYPEIESFYGKPYLLSSVTIDFVNELKIPNSIGEITIENSAQGIQMKISLTKFSTSDYLQVNTLLHEILHAWRGKAVLRSSALEEGSVVAATDALMFELAKKGILPRYNERYIQISNEERISEFNTRYEVHADTLKFYGNPSISEIYQLVGSAWYELHEEDPTFFFDFNEQYYALIKQGKAVDVATVRSIITSLIPTVNGKPTSQYLASEPAFNPR
jgi:hypothetical protein